MEINALRNRAKSRFECKEPHRRATVRESDGHWANPFKRGTLYTRHNFDIHLLAFDKWDLSHH